MGCAEVQKSERRVRKWLKTLGGRLRRERSFDGSDETQANLSPKCQSRSRRSATIENTILPWRAIGKIYRVDRGEITDDKRADAAAAKMA
jgi:hypothetical protein